MSETTPTPPETLKIATLNDVLPLDALALVGTVETPTETRSLLRHRGGRIEMVKVGDRIGGREVVAIETAALILAREGQTERLEIPARERGAA
ncbi:hypothetical protein C8N43_0249 [Litoreibacter ponti]|uniref:Uncharacterized protein n=1 Tax=Litoreibacter ponti TaxID=1510457 RepID=A0A2T6BHS3_9RHOB|nr:hypothetical protein [Litoreibacter ponti]PTX55610.1 hypothetical protein C8N43_0249 [Litoreibacter ponti]